MCGNLEFRRLNYVEPEPCPSPNGDSRGDFHDCAKIDWHWPSWKLSSAPVVETLILTWTTSQAFQ